LKSKRHWHWNIKAHSKALLGNAEVFEKLECSLTRAQKGATPKDVGAIGSNFYDELAFGIGIYNTKKVKEEPSNDW